MDSLRTLHIPSSVIALIALAACGPADTAPTPSPPEVLTPTHTVAVAAVPTTPAPTLASAYLPFPAASFTPTATYTPSSTPTSTQTSTLTYTPTLTPSNTVTPTDTSSPTPTASPTATNTSTSTATNTATSTPTITPIPRAMRNADWTPVIQTFDGVEMVLVPPGCFMMGSTDGDFDEQPVHEVCVDDPFWVDRYEVTNEQYVQLGSKAGLSSAWTSAHRPREQITWFEAREFCARRGARLPTEAEWEFAARGPDGLRYPWGNTFDPEFVVFYRNSGQQTADAGSRPYGASWVGALDLSGNLWEWVMDWYDAVYYGASPRDNPPGPVSGTLRVVRGGSWRDDEFYLRAANRNWVGPDNRLSNIGFRCARSY